MNNKKQLGVLILDRYDWLLPECGPGEARANCGPRCYIVNGNGSGNDNWDGKGYANVGLKEGYGNGAALEFGGRLNY